MLCSMCCAGPNSGITQSSPSHFCISPSQRKIYRIYREVNPKIPKLGWFTKLACFLLQKHHDLQWSSSISLYLVLLTCQHFIEIVQNSIIISSFSHCFWHAINTQPSAVRCLASRSLNCTSPCASRKKRSLSRFGCKQPKQFTKDSGKTFGDI